MLCTLQAPLWISIHALRVEGDERDGDCLCSGQNFYPRPPGGGRLQKVIGMDTLSNFYPRPPGGGRLLDVPLSQNYPLDFYPRPPGGGRRPYELQIRVSFLISIHALRVEGDLYLVALILDP